MMIRIVYEDGRYDLVKPFMLDKLLGDKQVRMFLRDGRWVSVGDEGLRREAMTGYSGLERRQGLNS